MPDLLERISIKHIKGIENKTFDLNLFPNKPSILVAPNGFGKSSIAIAFSSFNNARLILDDDNLFNERTHADSSIIVEHAGNIYIINNTSNNFSQTFSCFVINSSLYAKAKSQYMGSFMGAKASLEIEDVILEDKIPIRADVKYTISEIKTTFGANSKILPNIKYLIDNPLLIKELKHFDSDCFSKIKSYKNPLQNIIREINTYIGTKEQILEQVQNNLISNFDAITSLCELKKIIKKYSTNQISEALLYLESIQTADVLLDTNFGKYSNWCEYQINKDNVQELLTSFNTTGIELKLKEKPKKRELVLEFPSAKRISNGQRDILTFIAKLYKARTKLNKDNNILIIDEIFDYLDDAHLISFQYYITKFIEEYKKSGKKLYCLLLTHLDPMYFKHFCFNKHKLQVRYLTCDGVKCCPVILDLMRKRNDDTYLEKEKIEKFLFHYHVNDELVEGKQSQEWYHDLYNEVKRKYLAGVNYDVLKICLAVRIKIEELAYNEFSTDELKNLFLETHKTASKLNVLDNNSIEYPEIYRLLGIIYNDNLHWNNERDYHSPLKSKFSNLVIKSMISDIFKEGE